MLWVGRILIWSRFSRCCSIVLTRTTRIIRICSWERRSLRVDNDDEPCNERVEEDERDDWKDYVEDGGEPQHVDVEVPESI